VFSATRGLVEHAEDPSIEAAAAKLAVANCAGPVVLADHSERSGYATWLLRAVIEQGLARALVGTVADAKLVANLIADGAKIGRSFPAVCGRFDGEMDTLRPSVSYERGAVASTRWKRAWLKLGTFEPPAPTR